MKYVELRNLAATFCHLFLVRCSYLFINFIHRKASVLILSFFFFLFSFSLVKASSILISMDETQTNHLKAYGIAYRTLASELEVDWLLNYRGGSFLIKYVKDVENECKIRGVAYEVIADARANTILTEIANPEANMEVVRLEKKPKIVVYSPKNKLPWDDAVTMALTYAEIPYDLVYDEDVLQGVLVKYDWLHLHHEDFTGQYGRFWAAYKNAEWYQNDVRLQEQTANRLGFKKVSQMKLAVVQKIRDFCAGGGFLFAMCSGTDSFDIALSAEGVDICHSMFDGDPADVRCQEKINYDKTFAFKDFKLDMNPYNYEFSNIDVTPSRNIDRSDDFFVLFEFSAKWDLVPTMLTQNHDRVVKGFMGQTTAFKKELVKSEILVMGETKVGNEARYIHGNFGKGQFTFYGGHDPEDYQHLVGDPPTDLNLHPNSPGYRLILNNVLFPAAKKKKQKT